MSDGLRDATIEELYRELFRRLEPLARDDADVSLALQHLGESHAMIPRRLDARKGR